jgi:hypothetical protein
VFKENGATLLLVRLQLKHRADSSQHKLIGFLTHVPKGRAHLGAQLRDLNEVCGHRGRSAPQFGELGLSQGHE